MLSIIYQYACLQVTEMQEILSKRHYEYCEDIEACVSRILKQIRYVYIYRIFRI